MCEVYHDLTTRISPDVEAFVLRGSGFMFDIKHKSDKYILKRSNEFGMENPFWLYASSSLDSMGRGDGFSRTEVDFSGVSMPMSNRSIVNFMRHQLNSISSVLERFYYAKLLS